MRDAPSPGLHSCPPVMVTATASIYSDENPATALIPSWTGCALCGRHWSAVFKVCCGFFRPGSLWQRESPPPSEDGPRARHSLSLPSCCSQEQHPAKTGNGALAAENYRICWGSLYGDPRTLLVIPPAWEGRSTESARVALSGGSMAEPQGGDFRFSHQPLKT